MDRDKILSTLQDLLERDFEISRESVALNARLYEDLDMDSIDAVDLLAELFKLTGKRIDPKAFREVRTVGDLIDELERQLS